MIRLFLVGVFLMCACGGTRVSAQTDAWELGRSIFEKGIGRDGRKIGGRIHGGLLLRGDTVACSSCHGSDARGGGEAFIDVPDIRWVTLSKPYAPRMVGQSRTPYTRETFSRALHQGINSGERTLDPGMPRFDLSQDETMALVQYLKAPYSMKPTSNRLKVVLSLLPAAPHSMMAQALSANLLACPKQGEASRFPPLEILYYNTPSDAIQKIAVRLLEEDVAVILSPYIVGWEMEYVKASQQWGITTLLPLTPLDIPITTSLAYQFPGVTSQIQALVAQHALEGADKLSILTADVNELTASLVQVALATASDHSMAVEVVNSRETSSGPTGNVWLFLASSKDLVDWLVLQTHNQSITGLIPAMFFDPGSVETLKEYIPQSHWIVGYPYNPVSRTTGKWRSPVVAWTRAACAILAKLAEKPYGQWDKDEEIIRTNDGLMIMNVHSQADRIKQIVIREWKPAK